MKRSCFHLGGERGVMYLVGGGKEMRAIRRVLGNMRFDRAQEGITNHGKPELVVLDKNARDQDEGWRVGNRVGERCHGRRNG